ncbi:hypothetical protein WJX74_000332 [Apatococcus lobatus]|uniref:Chloride channel protein n=1 Tax=Apatococcus lobatus TaxID=904363 RepID=A0AAW1RBN1_9CHLO
MSQQRLLEEEPLLDGDFQNAKTPGHNYAESLDYSRPYNKVLAARLKNPPPQLSFCGVKAVTVVKLLATFLIGIVTGAAGAGLAAAQERLYHTKNNAAREIIHDGLPHGILRAFVFHLAYTETLVLIGASLVTFVAPAAAGAGVSLVMAYLNGSAIPDLLSGRTLIIKYLGTLAGITSNVAMGPEAPMVHLGASVAHVITHAVAVACEKGLAVWDWVWKYWHPKYALDHPEMKPSKRIVPASILYNDADRREFIGAGAAAGLAAAFGAPIGGVLFALEEMCTHWTRKTGWRCFICTAVAVFTLAQLRPSSKTGVLSFEGVIDMSSQDWFRQLPLFVLVNMGAGGLGATFNALHKAMFKMRAPRSSSLLRLLEVAIIAGVTLAMMFLSAYWLGQCIDIPNWHTRNYGFQFSCTNSYNDLATALFSNPDDTIKRLFSLGGRQQADPSKCYGRYPCYFTLRSLLVLCPSYLVYMALIGGLAIPGGLFMPAIMVGASFGGLSGLVLDYFLPSLNIQPGLYALCAATAMLGGVFRSSISLVVIVVEGTQNTRFLLGIIIAVVVSNWLADLIHTEGVYETDLEADATIIFLRPFPPKPLLPATAGEIMAGGIHKMKEVESVERIIELLRNTSHNGFPVVLGERPVASHDAFGSQQARSEAFDGPDGHGGPLHWAQDDSSPTPGALKGIILRSQLLVLLTRRAFCDARGIPVEQVSHHEASARAQDLDRQMRLFYRQNSFASHRRHMASDPKLLSQLGLEPKTGMLKQSEASARSSRANTPGHSRRQSFSSEQDVVAHLVRASFASFHRQDAESQAHVELHIDLRSFMDTGPVAVRESMPAERIHTMFLSLGLRHMVVVDGVFRVVGLITRKELDYAAGQGAWRRNRRASSPRRWDSGNLMRLKTMLVSSMMMKAPIVSIPNSQVLKYLKGSTC